MKPDYTQLIFTAVALVCIISLAGCAQPGPSCPSCPQPSAWSKCTEGAVKTRTNYQCSEETNYECQSYVEEGVCSTEISLTGANGLDATLSPTLEENVKGIIKVTVNSVPADVTKIWVMFSLQGMQMEEGQDPFNTPNILLEVVDAQAGKTIFLDTTKVENGVYTLGVMASSNPSGAPWADVVQTQLVVEN